MEFKIPKKSPDAVKIIPNVWVGNHLAAKDEFFFSKEKIQSVLNMSPNIPNNFPITTEYMRIYVYDSKKNRNTFLMKTYFPVITEYIYKTCVIENKNLLVNCWLGKQRSTTAVAAYLIKFYNMNPNEAINYILERKPDAFHNGQSVNFIDSLNDWYNLQKI